MFSQLAGARTYLLAIAAAVAAVYMAADDFTNFMGWADLPNIPEYVLVLIGAGGAASLRAAVK